METDYKKLRRLCKAILHDRFNDENYRSGGWWNGLYIQTGPVFCSYGTIGFDISSPYGESFRENISYDWEFHRLEIDDMDWRQYFLLYDFPWADIKNKRRMTADEVASRVRQMLADQSFNVCESREEALDYLGYTEEYDEEEGVPTEFCETRDIVCKGGKCKFCIRSYKGEGDREVFFVQYEYYDEVPETDKPKK